MEEENTRAAGKLTFMVGSVFFLELGLNRAQDRKGFLIMQVFGEILRDQNRIFCKKLNKINLIFNYLCPK